MSSNIYYEEIKIHSRDIPHHLIFTGDFHIGARTTNMKLLERCLKKIRELCNRELVTIMLLGDLFEAISYNDKRFDPQNIDPELWHKSGGDFANFQVECVNRAVELLRPVAKNISLILEGNHEAKMRRRGEMGPNYALAVRLQEFNPRIKFGVDWSYYVIYYSRVTKNKDREAVRKFYMYVTHGFGGGRTDGAAVNRMNELGTIHNVDLVVAGHYHKLNFNAGSRLLVTGERDRMELNSIVQYRMITPSFLKIYEPGVSTYGATRGYHPSVLGAVKLTLWPFKGEDENFMRRGFEHVGLDVVEIE